MPRGRRRGGNRGSGSAGGSTAPDTALPPAPGSCACACRRPAAHYGVRQNQAGTAGCSTTTPPPQHEATVTFACMGDIACIRLHVSLLAVKRPFCTRSLCSFNFALKAAVSATWQTSSAPLATNDCRMLTGAQWQGSCLDAHALEAIADLSSPTGTGRRDSREPSRSRSRSPPAHDRRGRHRAGAKHREGKGAGKSGGKGSGRGEGHGGNAGRGGHGNRGVPRDILQHAAAILQHAAS